MKLRELMEAVRGLDDQAFLDRFACPFLLEEGLLREETRRLRAAEEGAKHFHEIAERQVFPIRRRDGKPGDVTIGRGANLDIRLDTQSVSTRHAVFKPPGDGRSRWCVVDTVSTNGTFVDGVRIATGREVELNEATVLRFGPDLRLAFYEPSQLLTVLRQISKALDGKPHEKDGTGLFSTIAEAPKPRAVAASASRQAPVGKLRADETHVPEEELAPPPRKPESSGKHAPLRALAEDEETEATSAGEKTESNLRVVGASTLRLDPSKVDRGSDEAPVHSGPVPVDATIVLSCDPFAPLPLELHRPIVIGRVPGNDFVLPNPQVSRRHCEVERTREGVAVRDLKSANGTFMDGRRIDRAMIPIGGNVRIGPYTLEVRSLEPLPQQAGPSLGDTMIGTRTAEGIRGTFEDMSLVEILQGVEFNQKTGVIDIQGDDGKTGFVSYRGGMPHQARCNTLEGEPAIMALLRIKKGRFILRADEGAVGPRVIATTFTKILLEHGRISDESKK